MDREQVVLAGHEVLMRCLQVIGGCEDAVAEYSTLPLKIHIQTINL